MAREKSLYSVNVISYASQEVKERIERGEDVPIDEQFITENKYFDTSAAWAGEAFIRAVKRAKKNPLALRVILRQGLDLLADVKVRS